jgi:hypothetical protein
MLVELVLLVILMMAVPVIVALDIMVLKHDLTEISVTEFTQVGLLFASILLMWSMARQLPDSRGFLVLVTGFMSAMLIREYDKFLDYFSQGFWLYPVLLVSAGAIIYAIRLRDSVIAPMVRIMATKSFTYVVIGLLLVFVFSRAFGTSRLWSEAMGADYDRIYKTIVQEGVETLGYALVFFGSVQSYLHERRRQS